MKIGIIREGKTPPDSRVPLTPAQCKQVQNYAEVAIQRSVNRCYKDEEYIEENIPLSYDISDCDVLMGVKEVPKEQLIPNKTYFFFSHTIKKQSYNRDLLRTILQKNIRLLDYEVLTNEHGQRLIAFGYFAGMVGAHNALWTYAQRTGSFELKRMKDCFDYKEATAAYKEITWPAVKIVLTGTGRVGQGAAQVLQDMGIRKVSPSDFLTESFTEAVFTQLSVCDYVARQDDAVFEKEDFYKHPSDFKSIFGAYTKVSDIMINGIYWDNAAPAFFSKEAMQQADFKIKVIADVTCDIAPISSIPSTLDASTIADPVFGYNPATGKKDAPYQANGIDMMTIDNLPNEMPRDASFSFGNQFIEHILPELLKEDSGVIERATVTQNGQLGKHFAYLDAYVKGKE